MCLIFCWQAGVGPSTKSHFCFSVYSWFPHGLKNLENGKTFQSRNFEQITGKMSEFYPKYWKSGEIVASFYFHVFQTF